MIRDVAQFFYNVSKPAYRQLLLDIEHMVPLDDDLKEDIEIIADGEKSAEEEVAEEGGWGMTMGVGMGAAASLVTGAMDQADALQEQAEGYAQAATDKAHELKDRAQEVKDQAQARAEALQEHAEDYQQAAMDMAQDLKDQAQAMQEQAGDYQHAVMDIAAGVKAQGHAALPPLPEMPRLAVLPSIPGMGSAKVYPEVQNGVNQVIDSRVQHLRDNLTQNSGSKEEVHWTCLLPFD